MMFRRVIGFAAEFAQDRAASLEERAWVEKFAGLEEKSAQDVDVSEAFTAADEVNFWAVVFFNCAGAIFQRRIGNQENQDWQTATIWAMYQIGRMLATEHDRRIYRADEISPASPRRQEGRWKQYYKLHRKISRTLYELDEFMPHL